MWRGRIGCWWVVIGPVAGLAGEVSAASGIDQAVDAAANRLVSDQRPDGSWLGAEGFTGVIVSGLVNAYQLTGNQACRAAAEKGGQYILNSAPGYNFYGDEAEALTCLSELSEHPSGNPWRTAVATFYDRAAAQPGGTATYIADLKRFYLSDDSVPLLYLAHHTVAACYVNAADQAIWRQAVIDTLARVDNDDAYPVLSMGAAVWALARTGAGLDSTALPIPTAPGAYAGRKLNELPRLLAGHQVAPHLEYPRSFYSLFDHSWSPNAGYTEDTAYAAMGLIAATAAGWDYRPAILAARHTLVNGQYYGDPAHDLGVGLDGNVYEHIWLDSPPHYAFIGETLTALTIGRSPVVCGNPRMDADRDGDVDQEDFGLFQACWTGDGNGNLFDDDACHCFDMDQSLDIDTADRDVFTACARGPSVPADPACDGQ